MAVRTFVGAVLLCVVGLLASGCVGDDPSQAVPARCVAATKATRGSVEGTPVWARFCPGPRGNTPPAEIPSDALTTHLAPLAGLTEVAQEEVDAGERCATPFGRTYRLQVGYADGRIATIVGHTDPQCLGKTASGTRVRGAEGLGVYGLVMKAFGQQYADGFADAEEQRSLVCPQDPREPGSVEADGESTSVDTGWVLGERQPMVMPLTAVRGIVCTWPDTIDGPSPVIRKLSADEAERVRIGMHAIDPSMVDCLGSDDPTYTAVVEDRTGTRRAVTIIDSECETVIRSDGGHGLGFAWLDRS